MRHHLEKMHSMLKSKKAEDMEKAKKDENSSKEQYKQADSKMREYQTTAKEQGHVGERGSSPAKVHSDEYNNRLEGYFKARQKIRDMQKSKQEVSREPEMSDAVKTPEPTDRMKEQDQKQKEKDMKHPGAGSK